MGADHPPRPLSSHVSLQVTNAQLLIYNLYSGLSATIGEPEKFNAWLESVQDAHGFRHTFIHHPTRYSHLRKYTYMLQGEGNAVALSHFTELSNDIRIAASVMYT